MRTLALTRFSLRAARIVSGLILASCSTPRAIPPQHDVDAAQLLEWWKPHLLYLLPSPHPRLYVEVDAVEGCEPDEAALEKLRGFLSASCRKPDGIDIVRSDVIPVEAARGLSEKGLARKYSNGPDKTDGSPAAFMYVLFYNDALCPGTAPGSRLIARRSKVANPYTDVLLYPAIYFNTPSFPSIVRNEGLLHEAGHMLGLASRPIHAPDRHCQGPTCLMNTTLRMHRWFLGLQRQLCDRCVAELAQSSKEPPLPNLRYVGAVLVRSEADYHVLSLPDRLGIFVGSLTDRDCQDFAVAFRAETPHADRKFLVHCLVKDEVLKEPVKVSEMLSRLKDDPFDQVRNAGPKILLQACAGRYDALGRYSNAVDVLHQSVLLDSKDAQAYNQLAWIKATCSDASIRDGQQAVSAASKACDLTEWRDWTFIDTLAAAYAEAGDFKRAMQLQEQALRTGNPTGSEQKEMKERVSLYEHSQPFRDKQ